MATDFYPERPVSFDTALAAVQAGSGIVCVAEIGAREFYLTVDGGEFLRAHRQTDGNVIFTRYGHNDVETILRRLDDLLGVRVGPECEREPDDEEDRPVCESSGLHRDACPCPDCYSPTPIREA